MLAIGNTKTNSKDSIQAKKNYNRIEFYAWGMPDFGYSDTFISCENSLQYKYGFMYKRVAGCLVNSSDVRKWRRHNKRCERQMAKRHGALWRQNYEAELKQCNKKQQPKQ